MQNKEEPQRNVSFRHRIVSLPDKIRQGSRTAVEFFQNSFI